MFVKKSVSIIAAFITGIIIISTSCKKTDEFSSDSALSESQSVRTSSTNSSNENSESFTITSQDGHTIGVNGQQPTTPINNPKGGGTNSITGCGAASGVVVTAYPSSTGNALSCNWVSGSGSYVGVFINGKLYVDPATHYGLYNTMVSGIWAYCQGISGGIQPNETFKVVVRTYCNNDTTGSILGVNCFDSPISTIVTPSTFVGTCGATTGGTTKGGKGHR